MRAQHLGDDERAAVVLVVLEQEHERAADRARSSVQGVHELRVALDRTTWRLTFWKPSNKVIVVLTVFRKAQDGTQTADIDRAIAAKKRCEAEHDLTATHVFERSA